MTASICLGIETAASHLGLSLVPFSRKAGVGKPLASVFIQQPLRQSDGLFPELTKLLRKKKLSQKNISLVAVDTGPGSFTGVRVGVSAGRALAQALDIPAVGVNSLECLALQAEAPAGLWVGSVLPALSGEAYFGLFRKETEGRIPKPVVPPMWTDFSTITRTLNRKAPRGKAALTSMNPAQARVKTGIENFSWLKKNNPVHPDTVGRIGALRFLSGRKKWSYDRLVPMYLQPSWAEREKLKKK